MTLKKNDESVTIASFASLKEKISKGYNRPKKENAKGGDIVCAICGKSRSGESYYFCTARVKKAHYRKTSNLKASPHYKNSKHVEVLEWYEEFICRYCGLKRVMYVKFWAIFAFIFPVALLLLANVLNKCSFIRFDMLRILSFVMLIGFCFKFVRKFYDKQSLKIFDSKREILDQYAWKINEKAINNFYNDGLDIFSKHDDFLGFHFIRYVYHFTREEYTRLGAR